MEMAGLQHSVVINRPPAEVFSFVSDLENDRQCGASSATSSTRWRSSLSGP
jgi:hypothetical protein